MKLSFTYEVMCDPEITEDGGAVFKSMNIEDECAPEVTYAHAAGCHKVKTIEIPGTNTTETVIVKEVKVQLLTDFIMDNPIIFGIILILIGAPIAFFGHRWFKSLLSGFGGFSGLIIIAFTA